MYQHSGKQGGTAGSHGEHGMLADLGKLPLTRRAATDQEWAHNPKVVGSNPTPATNESPGRSHDLPGPLSLSTGTFSRSCYRDGSFRHQSRRILDTTRSSGHLAGADLSALRIENGLAVWTLKEPARYVVSVASRVDLCTRIAVHLSAVGPPRKGAPSPAMTRERVPLVRASGVQLSSAVRALAIARIINPKSALAVMSAKVYPT
jgi:hypothetical protein